MRHQDPYLKFKLAHMVSLPALTAERWCNYCGGKHRGPCKLVFLPADEDHKTPYVRRAGGGEIT